MIIYQFAHTNDDEILHEKYFLHRLDALAYKQDYELGEAMLYEYEYGTVKEIIIGEYSINTIVVKESYDPNDFS